jgi:hypothetical protein
MGDELGVKELPPAELSAGALQSHRTLLTSTLVTLSATLVSPAYGETESLPALSITRAHPAIRGSDRHRRLRQLLYDADGVDHRSRPEPVDQLARVAGEGIEVMNLPGKVGLCGQRTVADRIVDLPVIG